jgi:lipopolysaccharide transport system ATP-binding protein
MTPILEVQHISKKYKIQHLAGGYLSLRERMTQMLKFEKSITEDFWAVNDVSFTVNPGESVGIIGRNGAGKSTLLKILSRITPPTKGKITVRGRLASLLEVGTGFHPELTGRENIFFNGSLLGMKRREIESKFDEIVNFSGVENFLDTPLKHFSSGMQLRLAFAVAAFLEPEIMIIDEVLAVGDAEFQKKCLRKMEDVSDSGRTILFVSHNMQAVANLCKKGIYLVNGRVEAFDSINNVIDSYMSREKIIYSNNELLSQLAAIKPDPDFRLNNIIVRQDAKEIFANAQNGKDLEVEVHYEILRSLNAFRLFLDVIDQFGTVIFRTFHDEDKEVAAAGFSAGKYFSRVTIPSNLFAPVSYNFKLNFGIHNERMMEPVDGFTFRLNMEQSGTYNKAYHGQHTAGLLCPVFPWKIQRRE